MVAERFYDVRKFRLTTNGNSGSKYEEVGRRLRDMYTDIILQVDERNPSHIILMGRPSVVADCAETLERFGGFEDVPMGKKEAVEYLRPNCGIRRFSVPVRAGRKGQDLAANINHILCEGGNGVTVSKEEQKTEWIYTVLGKQSEVDRCARFLESLGVAEVGMSKEEINLYLISNLRRFS